MRNLFILFISILVIISTEVRSECVIAIPDDCPGGKVCAKFNEKGDSKCFDVPKHAPLQFDLPFPSNSKVICSQSGRFSSATHVYRNMLYAIDLATPYSPNPNVGGAARCQKEF